MITSTARARPPRVISKGKGRALLASLVVIALVVAFIMLQVDAAGGGLHPSAERQAFRQLLDVYVPLLAMMAGFYFADRGRAKDKSTSLQALVFAGVVTTLWLITPIYLLARPVFIEDVVKTIDEIKVLGSSIAVAAVAFYFGR